MSHVPASSSDNRHLFRGRLFAGKRPYEEIDSAIKPLVDRMNGTGAIRTIASCQGHPIGGYDPYVYFFAEISVAAAIERHLREIAIRDDPALHFVWVLEGCFNENYELAFGLYSPTQRDRANSLLNLTPEWFLNRKRLVEDFRSLAWIIEDAVFSQVRDIEKPKITEAANNHN